MNRDDIIRSMSDEELDQVLQRFGHDAWVVMNKAGTSMVQDPGSRQPFFTKLRKRAEQIAKETGGVAVRFNEAFKIILHSNRDDLKKN